MENKGGDGGVIQACNKNNMQDFFSLHKQLIVLELSIRGTQTLDKRNQE